MSHKVATLVYSRRVGSAHRKAILAYMADRASDNGQGVFCSKGTIADETEIARSTVFKTIRELVDEGVLIEAGQRSCRNGATVVYDLDLDVISAFPVVSASGDNPSASRTPTSPPAGRVRSVTSPPAGPHQSASRTPTSPPAGPKPSLEPSLNVVEVVEVSARTSARDETALLDRVLIAVGLNPADRLPAYWMPPASAVHVAGWRRHGLTDDQIVQIAAESRARYDRPPDGPRALDRTMAGQAAAITAALNPPAEGGTDGSQQIRPFPDPGPMAGRPYAAGGGSPGGLLGALLRDQARSRG